MILVIKYYSFFVLMQSICDSEPGYDIGSSWLQCWDIVELAVISSLLEELRIVMFAVKSPFKGCIIGGADCATTMDTFEAVLMIWETFHTCLWHRQPTLVPHFQLNNNS
jgi:hypothetical protein